MVTVVEVLQMLIPNGGWAVSDNKWENVQFFECEPITKEQFDAGVIDYPAWKAEQEATKAAAKLAAEAKLAALGLTADDLKALGL